MLRVLAIAIIATACLPVDAEAARLRFGKGHSSATVIPVPRAGHASAPAEPAFLEARRVPFPSPSADRPVPLRVSSSEGAKAWCQSEVVVGGFCVMH
jgi:hypothetical protein